MARTFSERLNQAITSGGKYETFWQKTFSAITLGRMYHTFLAAGVPAAGVYPGVAKTATALAGGATPTVAGGYISTPDPLTTEQALAYFIDALSSGTNVNGTLIIGDLLATYQGFDGNTAASQATLGTPTTGDNILTRYTNAEGVLIFADVQTALGATSRALSVVYTDQGGATGTTDSRTTIASVGANTLPWVYDGLGPFFQLAAGDRGVKSIQSCALAVGGTGGGTFALNLFKPLITINVAGIQSSNNNYGRWDGFCDLDAVLLQGSPALSMIWVPAASVAGTLSGTYKKINMRLL